MYNFAKLFYLSQHQTFALYYSRVYRERLTKIRIYRKQNTITTVTWRFRKRNHLPRRFSLVSWNQFQIWQIDCIKPQKNLKPFSVRFRKSITAWVIDWLIGWLIDGLIGWLIDWLTDWVIDWLVGGLADWLIDWLIDRMIELIEWLVDTGWWSGDGWRETMSQDRHDRAAADTGRPQGRPMTSRGQGRGGWGPRSSRGARRPQCTLSLLFLQFWCQFKVHFAGKRHSSIDFFFSGSSHVMLSGQAKTFCIMTWFNHIFLAHLIWLVAPCGFQGCK